jgi:D-tyrosyl-tRNA(Tyr) deacylase
VRVVIQRVTRASVTIGNETAATIGPGLLLLVGVAAGDDAAVARRMARKCAEMRLFADDGRFDRSLIETGGEALVVSQFTLVTDVRKGRRPSFIDAAPPDVAAPLVDAFTAALREQGIVVATGRFGAMMQVESVNDGPVTIVVDSAELDRSRRGRDGAPQITQTDTD